MNLLKRLFARKRKRARIVIEFRRADDGKGVVQRLSVENTEGTHEYVKKCMAMFLFGLARGLFERTKEVGAPSPGAVKAAVDAYELACLLLMEPWKEMQEEEECEN